MRFDENHAEAMNLARRIEQKLLSEGSSGDFLGSKRALMTRFGIGRPTLEIVIRHLEINDLAEMRPGPAGGLYRCEGAYAPAAISLATYITLERVTHSDVLDAHQVLFEELVARAADSPRENKEQLEALVEAYLRSAHTVPTLQRFQSSLWHYLTAMVGDAALGLGLHSLEWIQRTIILNELPRMQDEGRLVQMVKAWDRRVVRAILNGDRDGAAQLARKELCIVRRHIDQAIAHGELPTLARLRTPFKSNRGNSTGKLAMPTARALSNRVLDNALPCNFRLGTIESLAIEMGVSVEVMRQSVRLVQEYGLVRSLPGRQGGVFAGKLCDTQTMRICAAHYARIGMTREVADLTFGWMAKTKKSAQLSSGAARIIGTLGKTLTAYTSKFDNPEPCASHRHSEFLRPKPDAAVSKEMSSLV